MGNEMSSPNARGFWGVAIKQTENHFNMTSDCVDLEVMP